MLWSNEWINKKKDKTSGMFFVTLILIHLFCSGSSSSSRPGKKRLIRTPESCVAITNNGKLVNFLATRTIIVPPFHGEVLWRKVSLHRSVRQSFTSFWKFTILCLLAYWRLLISQSWVSHGKCRGDQGSCHE